MISQKNEGHLRLFIRVKKIYFFQGFNFSYKDKAHSVISFLK